MKAFTYLIGWSSHNKFYFGVRFAKGCSTSDIWTTYFTSSKHVKRFALLNGPPDIIQIREVFENVNEARNYETKILRRLLTSSNKSIWLNKTYNPSIPPSASSVKGKTYEEIYGPEKAAELRLIRKNTLGKCRIGRKHSEEAKLKMSNTHFTVQAERWKGKTYEDIYGIERANELKENHRNKLLGRKHSEETKTKRKISLAQRRLTEAPC